ncbi:MAG: hypothetical protein AB1696_28335 [Planctomycetota bacterium]
MRVCDLEKDRQSAVLPQRQAGLARVRCAVPAGDLTAETLERLCAIAEKYGDGDVRCSSRHEIEIPSLREEDIAAVLAELRRLPLRVDGILERPNVVACPGADECQAAYVKTKKLCHDIEAFLTEAAEQGPLPREFRVALSGCPNECSHGHINDIGFVGSVGARGGRKLRGFDLVVGGSVHGEGRLGERIAFVSPEDVVPTLRDLLSIHRENTTAGISFSDFFLDIGPEELMAKLEEKLSERIWFFEI